MTGTSSARGGLGWVILAVALAVPGVLFYNWWSRLKAEREKAVAVKARGRVPDGGVFRSSPNAKLVNPMTPTVATKSETAPAASSATAAAAAAPTALAAAPAAGVVLAPVSSLRTAVAPLKRDPTISPFDRVRLLEEEEARRRAAEDLENAAKPKPRARALVTPETLVELQGIISNPVSGFKAIVNNEVVGAGEKVIGTQIKVITINDKGVMFEYQGKRFLKGVGPD